MNRIRFILLALILALLLIACERPAPEGEIPSPSDNPDIVPRSTLDITTPGAEPTLPETADMTATPGTDTTTDGTNTDTPATDDGTLLTATPETTSDSEGTGSDAPPLENGVYTVRAGDTLGQIAFIYGITVEEIMSANNLTNPDVLDVGQQLVIPAAGSTTAPNPTQVPGSTDDTTGDTSAGERTHTVQAGENLYRIGLQYGFTVDELAEYNNLTDVNSLVVGQIIRIPPSN